MNNTKTERRIDWLERAYKQLYPGIDKPPSLTFDDYCIKQFEQFRVKLTPIYGVTYESIREWLSERRA